MTIVKLPAFKSHDTLVDEDIANKLKGKKLCLFGKTPYIGFTKECKKVALHRFVMDFPKCLVVDHKNGDIYDNRRSNLRACTHSENMLNRRHETKASSRYRLVYRLCHAKTYRLSIRIKNKKIYFGHFRSNHIAGIFADQILVKFVGLFVKKNFPEKITISELRNFLDRTSGKIFRVVFSHRSDGIQREMVCRTGVNSRHNNGTIPFDPSSMNLFSVYDVHKRSYRFIPLENVICIRFAKTNYRVVS